MKSKYLIALRRELRMVADPARAPQMQAYMKSEMPYHGVSAPVAKKIFKKVFAQAAFASETAWQNEVLAIWRLAEFREERYSAIALAEHKSARGFQTPAAMKMYEEMIVTGAWWDFVDSLGGHHVGTVLRDYPGPMKKKMRSWSRSADMWKRRVSIICQLGFGKDTDLKLLYDCIEPSAASDEFFLRKAIGWALRQYAWVNPAEIKRYVRQNESRLSGLSRREALKNI